ncbi:hypothetical protein JOE63_001209 [Cellulosimicrobium cellulans]|uniref:glycosyl hydrolase family 95 catalytic domain-containing protein n=1 Tax=Cellulosimicrobium cellulans TaxID=1710 RepID=UPI00195AB0B2|nr:RICIN domain-containing protein [Cellulosimicrobium cellulans]MBM7818732.1 hypothetical protein [Cellulosimicrobium cellulans]
MGFPDIQLDRRGFLTASAYAAGAVLLANGALAPRAAVALAGPDALPERGLFDATPGHAWTDAFLSGNGEVGAMVYGTPDAERVVLNHHRFVLPNGTRDLPPPDLSARFASVQDKALAGDYRGATEEFTAGWHLRWTQSYHPGYALRLDAPEMAGATGYLRSTDYRTGEIVHSWTGPGGTWTRRVFVSRGSDAVVHVLVPPAGRTVDLVLGADTALPGTPSDVGYSVATQTSGRNGYLTVRGTYPAGQGAYGFEGVTRAVVTGSGSSVSAAGPTLVVRRAARLVLLTKLGRYERAGEWDARPLHSALAVMLVDYDALLRRHLPEHQALVDGSTLRLAVPDADRSLDASGLTARQNAHRAVLDLALLEAMYDSGRYLFASSSGVLPPRLTGIWSGEWGAAWADDFTTDANVNLQVAGGNILTHDAAAMRGYFELVLGQLDDWRTNARRLYGARGFLAPSRTDGESGYMLHFDADFPGHAWTGGADWLLYPLIEYVQVSGDQEFYRTRLAPVLMELALFYEDYLSRTDSEGNAVFVPSFSMENSPSSTGAMLSINATGEISAGRHALQSAIDAANALGVEQGDGEGVARWTALLERMPGYVVNGDDALAEWSWPGLTDRYNHRHVHHLYGAWPLHELNPEDEPRLAQAAHRALVVRGDENVSGHGSLHRALAYARLKDGNGVHDNLRKILGSNMVFRSFMTSHNPELHTFNADSAHAIPAVVAESLVCSRPGFLELLPAVPDTISSGEITGVRGRNRVLVDTLSWDLGARRASARLVSAVDQDLTLVSRRGIVSITVSGANATASPLGPHARTLALREGVPVEIEIALFPGACRLVNRASGKVVDVDGASRDDGAGVLLWPWNGAANQRWRLRPGYGGGFALVSLHSDKALESPGSVTTSGHPLAQWTDGFSPNQWWRPVPASSGAYRLVNVETGLCLDVADGSTDDGAFLVHNPVDATAASQEWLVEAAP